MNATRIARELRQRALGRRIEAIRAAVAHLEAGTVAPPPEARERALECRLLAGLRRRGWRLGPDGLWIGPQGERVEGLSTAARRAHVVP